MLGFEEGKRQREREGCGNQEPTLFGLDTNYYHNDAQVRPMKLFMTFNVNSPKIFNRIKLNHS
jgi:hypothetical protein